VRIANQINAFFTVKRTPPKCTSKLVFLADMPPRLSTAIPTQATWLWMTGEKRKSNQRLFTVQREVDALGVITISRGCFGAAAEIRKLPRPILTLVS